MEIKNRHTLALLCRGLYREAAGSAQRALADASRSLTSRHPERLRARYNQARVLFALADYEQALRINKEVVRDRIAVLSSDTRKLYESICWMSNPDFNAVGHASALAEIRKRLFLDDDLLEVAESLHGMAGVYFALGDLEPAERLYLQALMIQRNYIGAMEPEKVATSQTKNARALKAVFLESTRSMGNLGHLRAVKGDLESAGSLLEKALSIRRRLYLKDSPQLASAQNNLAGLRVAAGRFAEAEKLYKRALAIRERFLGKHHIMTAATQFGLAQLLLLRREYTRAEPLIKEALATRRARLPGDHPLAAMSLIQLGELQQIMGRYTEAIVNLQKGIALLQNRHASGINLVNSRLSLAAVWTELGHYDKAKKIYTDLVGLIEGKVGRLHPRWISARNGLANVSFARGLYPAAARLYSETLKISRRLHVDFRPGDSYTLEGLAWSRYALGDYTASGELFTKTCGLREKSLGPMHPALADSLDGQACARIALDQADAADEPALRALRIREHNFGSEHDKIAASMDTLCVLRLAQGRLEEAASRCERSLAIREKIFGSNHLELAISLVGLARARRSQGRVEDAEKLLQRALAIRTRALENDHVLIADTLSALAALHQAQGRYAQAETMLRRALGIRERLLGSKHASLIELLHRLSLSVYAQGRGPEANALCERALDISKKLPDGMSTQGHAVILDQQSTQAWLYTQGGKLEKAARLYRRAVRGLERAAKPERRKLGAALKDLAEVLRKQGKPDEAEDAYNRALASLRKVSSSEPLLAKVHYGLARLRQSQGKFPNAEQQYRLALAVLSHQENPDKQVLISTLDHLAGMQLKRNRPQEAAELYLRLLGIQEQVHGTAVMQTGLTLVQLADTMKIMKKFQAAAQFYTRALSIFEKKLGPDNELVGRTLLVCAACNWSLGRKAMARKQKKRAAGILFGRKAQTSSKSKVTK
ncbi:MAG TPA: tetratricopeptide repeat protein [Myxococcota bacterium]|nr:tetratricopeptide repeat protein [Myxococcota bacterium]